MTLDTADLRPLGEHLLQGDYFREFVLDMVQSYNLGQDIVAGRFHRRSTPFAETGDFTIGSVALLTIHIEHGHSRCTLDSLSPEKRRQSRARGEYLKNKRYVTNPY
jgi:hypothetical protein